MKLVFSIFILVVLVACDPAYHLTYAVVNDSPQTIYCVDRTKRGAPAFIPIAPDSTLEVYYESGFGNGRGQFKESRADVSSRFTFYADSSLADSSRIVPDRGWKYYPLPIGDYNARIYIRNKDLK